MNNKKGMFTGFSKVFKFTAEQNIKGSGFKMSTIVIALIIAAILIVAEVAMAVSQKDDDIKEEDVNSILDKDVNVEADIYYINESEIDSEYIDAIAEVDNFKKSSFTRVEEAEVEEAKKNPDNYLKDNKKAAVMLITSDDEKIDITIYKPSYFEGDEYGLDTIGGFFESYIKYVYVNKIANLDELHNELYNANTMSQSLEAGEEPESIGVILTRIFLPMVFSLVLYMMLLTYGQNITKIIVAEKSSKLMETLLTSVKPYAIISGKIVAVVLLAVGQMAVWIGAGVAGYKAGDVIAKSINKDYINYISLLMDTMSDGTKAFSGISIALAIVVLVVGFFVFSVIAGMVAAVVDKMEDISSVMGLYQIPVIVGFLGAYFVQMSENNSLKQLTRIIPVTSPFCVPADVIIGNATLFEAVVSLGILLVTAFVLICVTGKIYKGKLFNRH